MIDDVSRLAQASAVRVGEDAARILSADSVSMADSNLGLNFLQRGRLRWLDDTALTFR